MDAYRTAWSPALGSPEPARSVRVFYVGAAVWITVAVVAIVSLEREGVPWVVVANVSLAALGILYRLYATLHPRYAARYFARVDQQAEAWLRAGGPLPRGHSTL